MALTRTFSKPRRALRMFCEIWGGGVQHPPQLAGVGTADLRACAGYPRNRGSPKTGEGSFVGYWGLVMLMSDHRLWASQIWKASGRSPRPIFFQIRYLRLPPTVVMVTHHTVDESLIATTIFLNVSAPPHLIAFCSLASCFKGEECRCK